jgi:hypothetical protein
VKEELLLVKEGLVQALIGQRPYEMGLSLRGDAARHRPKQKKCLQRLRWLPASMSSPPPMWTVFS